MLRLLQRLPQQIICLYLTPSHDSSSVKAIIFMFLFHTHECFSGVFLYYFCLLCPRSMCSVRHSSGLVQIQTALPLCCPFHTTSQRFQPKSYNLYICSLQLSFLSSQTLSNWYIIAGLTAILSTLAFVLSLFIPHISTQTHVSTRSGKRRIDLVNLSDSQYSLCRVFCLVMSNCPWVNLINEGKKSGLHKLI